MDRHRLILTSPFETTVDTGGAVAAVPPLSCPQAVRVGGNTASGRSNLQQIMRLWRLRWHRYHTVAVQLFHFLVLLSEGFLEALRGSERDKVNYYKLWLDCKLYIGVTLIT